MIIGMIWKKISAPKSSQIFNELQVRSQLESLLDESIDVIGADKIQEMKQISDNAAFFAAMVR